MICGSGRVGSGFGEEFGHGGRKRLHGSVDGNGATLGESLFQFLPVPLEPFRLELQTLFLVGSGHPSGAILFQVGRGPAGDLTGGADGMQAGEQDEARDVDHQQDDGRAHGAQQILEQQAADPFPDPAAGTGDIQPLHVEQRPGQQMREAGAGRDESNAPPGTRGEAHLRIEQLGAAVAEEQRGQQIRRGAEKGVAAARHDGATAADEIQHGATR